MFRYLSLTLLLTVSCCHTTSAGSLTTAYNNDNGQDGIMFDLDVKANVLTVTSFDVNLGLGIYTVLLYTRPGTHVGFENSPAGWSLVDTVSGVNSSGEDNPTPIDFTDFLVPPNATTAIYLTSTSDTNAGWNYTNGTGLGNVAAQNFDLAILEGTGKNYAFSNSFTPRIFNGTVHYNNVVPEPASFSVLCMAGALLLARRRIA